MKNTLGRLLPTILSWMGLVIVIALAPTIATYNGHVSTNVAAATNAAYMIGMTTVDDFGGFLMIMGLLVSTGLFAWSASKVKNYTVGDMIGVVGAVIITVIVLAIFSGNIIGYFDELITAGGAGFEKTVYGLFPIITYIVIIGGASVSTGAKALRKRKTSKSSYRY